MKPTSGNTAALVSSHNVAENGSPQLKTLYAHLVEVGEKGISQFEALHLYRVAALPRRMADLVEMGVPIRKENRQDRTGRRYVRYFLNVATKGHSE